MCGTTTESDGTNFLIEAHTAASRWETPRFRLVSNWQIAREVHQAHTRGIQVAVALWKMASLNSPLRTACLCRQMVKMRLENWLAAIT